MAVCAAAAAAGAVSAALDGRPSADVLTVAIRASTEAESLRPCGEVSSIAAAVQDIYSDLAKRKHLVVDDLANQSSPTTRRISSLWPLVWLWSRSQHSKPPCWRRTSAAAIAGALHPETVNEDWFKVVNLINEDDLLDVAASLAALRRNGSS